MLWEAGVGHGELVCGWSFGKDGLGRSVVQGLGLACSALSAAEDPLRLVRRSRTSETMETVPFNPLACEDILCNDAESRGVFSVGAFLAKSASME